MLTMLILKEKMNFKKKIKISLPNPIDLSLIIIFTAAWINFFGASLLVGCIFFNWGCHFTGNILGSIFWVLFVGSSFNLVAQLIFFQLCKQETKSRHSHLNKVFGNSIERSFLKESLMRDFDKLSRSELKKLTVNYALFSQELLNYLNLGTKSLNLIKDIQATLDFLPSRPDSERDDDE
jgi:hypothetical protein